MQPDHTPRTGHRAVQKAVVGPPFLLRARWRAPPPLPTVGRRRRGALVSFRVPNRPGCAPRRERWRRTLPGSRHPSQHRDKAASPRGQPRGQSASLRNRARWPRQTSRPDTRPSQRKVPRGNPAAHGVRAVRPLWREPLQGALGTAGAPGPWADLAPQDVGTRVEATAPVAGFTQSIATVDELEQFGATHVLLVHDVDEIVADLVLGKGDGLCRWQPMAADVEPAHGWRHEAPADLLDRCLSRSRVLRHRRPRARVERDPHQFTGRGALRPAHCTYPPGRARGQPVAIACRTVEG